MAQLFRGIGKQIQVGVAKESTRGTANTTGTVYWLAVSDWSLDERYQNALDTETYGVIEDAVSETRVKDWSEGTAPMPVGDKSFPLLLLSLFGTDSPLQRPGDTAVYDHRITVQQGVQHQSVTFLIHDPIPNFSGASADQSYANSVVAKMDIEYQLGSFIKYTPTFRGLKGVIPSTGAFSPSQTAENRFVPQYLSAKFANTVAGIATTTAIALRSLKLSIDQNLEDDDTLGSTSPRDFLNKEFKVEGEFEAIWKDEGDFKTKALANTLQVIEFKLTNTDVTIGSSGNPVVSFLMPNVKYTEISIPKKLKDLVYQTVKFKAHYDITTAQMIRATCTNLVASY